MHQPAGKAGDDADSLDGLPASPKLQGQEVQQGSAKHMDPTGRLVQGHLSFIGAEDRLLRQDLLQPLFSP